jgi:hypothetical protein
MFPVFTVMVLYHNISFNLVYPNLMAVTFFTLASRDGYFTKAARCRFYFIFFIYSCSTEVEKCTVGPPGRVSFAFFPGDYGGSIVTEEVAQFLGKKRGDWETAIC